MGAMVTNEWQLVTAYRQGDEEACAACASDQYRRPGGFAFAAQGWLCGAATALLTLEIITPRSAVELLLGRLENVSLERPQQRPLAAILKAAAAALDRGQVSTAVHQLTALGSQLRAHLNGTDQSWADAFMSEVRRLMELIEEQRRMSAAVR